MRLLLVCVLLSAPLWAQTNPPYRVGNGVSTPKLIHKQEPEYSEEARLAVVNGTVLLELLVGETGMPEGVRVKRGIGFGLDENAVAAVENWRFNPGTKEGSPVRVMATIEVGYRLMDANHSDQQTSLNFDLAQGQTRPVLTRGNIPQNVPNNAQDKMRIKIMVDNGGKINGLQVIETTNKEWSNLAQREIAGWHFQANSAATAMFELSNSSQKSSTKPSGPVTLVPISNAVAEDTTLPSPQLIAPNDKEQFSIFPRTTTFRWLPVQGAASYLLEWDYGKEGTWEAETAKRPGIAYTVAGTQFSFDFVGAQMGRWRVWPVNTQGQKGTASEWRTFRHLK